MPLEQRVWTGGPRQGLQLGQDKEGEEKGVSLSDRQKDPFGLSQGSGRAAGQAGPDLASSETCVTSSGGASLLLYPL